MKIDGKEYRTIWFENNILKIIDQTKLPHQFIIKDLKTVKDAINAIKLMEVRGAPLIGATAAYGLVLAILENNDQSFLKKSAEDLVKARPTAINLKWAVDRMMNKLSGVNSEKIFNIALNEAKEAWLASRIPYGQTEGYRFYDGPIDDSNGPEGQLNAWPLDESYIDYVDGNANSGIINDVTTYPTLDANLIKSVNEQGAPENVSTGYHAIEFLLWGQDLTAGPGAGVRPFTDFVSGSGGTASNQSRRAAYLNIVIDILIEDLQSMVNAWAVSSSDNFRSQFVALNEDVALGKILKGIAELSSSELSGERMTVALDNGSAGKEDEHSCFSDNTHVDIQENARSVQNVYLGSYTRTNGNVISGPGIYELVGKTDATIAIRLNNELEDSMTAVNAIQAPFDQEIIGASTDAGPTRVKTAIDELVKAGASIVEAGAAIGITVNL